MTENESERKRRKIVIDWKRDREESSRRRTPRSSRPRYDRTPRNIILVALALIVIMLAAGFLGISSSRSATERRNFDLRPRNTDIWAVYPDGSLHFVTLNFDVKPEADQEVSLEAQVAGPLLFTREDVTGRAVIGGSLDGIEERPGPGGDSNLVYELFTLTRDSFTKSYGAEVISRTSPYINVNPTTGDSILSLGTQPEGVFVQVIVAVALPKSATITRIGDPASDTSLQPYRQIQIGDWQVSYFDLTLADGTEAIHVYYSMLQSSERPKLNYMKIDRRR